MSNNSSRHKIRDIIKNLKSHYPLVISCTPRQESESFAENWQMSPPSSNQSRLDSDICETIRRQPSRIYKESESVGRNALQVGILSDGSFDYGDAECFGKWSQALSSMEGLLESTLADESANHVAFLPIVVVPDWMLWQVDYSSEGKMEKDPRQIKRVSYWVGKQYIVREKYHYNVSHIEFMTLSGLIELLSQSKQPVSLLHRLFD